MLNIPTGELEMTEAQSDLAFALKMYGEAMVANAKAMVSSDKMETQQTYENMVFWQEQSWLCAKNVAAEK